MDIPIQHEAFSGRGLYLRPGTFLKGPRVLIDGAEAKGRFLKYFLRDNSGNKVLLRLKSNGLDPIPKIVIGGQTIEIARPLAWYEYLWMGLPIVLAFYGGALGTLVGLFAIYSSSHVFRSDRSTGTKFAISAAISIGSVVFFIVCIVILKLFLGQSSLS